MSFVEAAQLATLGANRVRPHQTALSQNVDHGIIALTPTQRPENPARASVLDASAQPAGGLQIFPGLDNRLSLPTTPNHFLRTLQRNAPTLRLKNEAALLLRRQPLVMRSNSKAAQHAQQNAMRALMMTAHQQPALAPSIGSSISITTRRQQRVGSVRATGAYQALRLASPLTKLQPSAPEIISLRQLPAKPPALALISSEGPKAPSAPRPLRRRPMMPAFSFG